jgi:ABC-type tungstate transport system permease subunit
MASAVASEPLNTLKLAVVSDNYDAGILKNLLIKAKHVPKNRIAHIDYYTSTALPIPKGCDIAIVSTMSNLREFMIIPPASCTEILLIQQKSDAVTATRLMMQDRMDGTAVTLRLS